MDRFGSDKPDTRFGLELFDIGDIIMQSEFQIVKNTLQQGGIVRGIRIPGGAKFSRKEIDDITKIAVSFGAKALANIIYQEDGTPKSPVLKFVTDEQAKTIQERAQAQVVAIDEWTQLSAGYCTENGMTFELTENDTRGTVVRITGYTAELPRELVIPAELGGYPVLEIAANAFENAPLDTVVLAEGIVFLVLTICNIREKIRFSPETCG